VMMSAMTLPPEQLVLALPHRPALELEDFLVSESNEEAVRLVDRWPDWSTGAAILVGPPGSGKSHLANVWQARSNATVVVAEGLAVADVPGVAGAPALVVEDVARLADQTALFHLLNLVKEQRMSMLITSDVRPGDLNFALPDLMSRLKALPLAHIAAPDDTLLRAVLVKLFADRQISVDPHIVDFLLMRMERSMAAARAVVAEVDRQAMTLQRAVTRPVASRALQALGFGGESD
jgi:chromosomal replication initiation ATPase DnaA